MKPESRRLPLFRSWGMLLLCLSGIFLASPARSATLLAYGPTAGCYADATAGYTVTIWDAATWSTKTTADFAAFDVITFGDCPTCFTSTSLWAAAIANRAVWSAAITGNKVIFGADPDFHGRASVVYDMVNFAANDPAPGPGLYVALSCVYASTAVATPVDLLGGFGTFMAISSGCGEVVKKLAAHPALVGVTSAGLSGWGCSTHEGFTSWPASWLPLAMATDAPSKPYTAADGSTGLVYILASGPEVVSIFTPTPSPPYTLTISPTITQTPTISQTFSHSPTNSMTSTMTQTVTHSPTHTITPSITQTRTITLTSTHTATATATLTATPTFTITQTSTATTSRTATPTATPTATYSNTPTPTATRTATLTATQTSTWTSTQTNTPTCTITSTWSNSPTYTDSPTITPTWSISPTFTPSPTPIDQPGVLAVRCVYPNPFHEDAHFCVVSKRAGRMTMQAYNVAGEIIASRSADIPLGISDFIWDGRNDAGARCASGIYLVRMILIVPEGGESQDFIYVAVAR